MRNEPNALPTHSPSAEGQSRIPAGAVTLGEYRRKNQRDSDRPAYARMLAYQCVGALLPEPYLEYLYAKPERKLRADLAWPTEKLLVEIQGGLFDRRAHGSIQGLLMDNDRLREAVVRGWRVLRFIPGEVDSGVALLWIERVLKGER